MAGFTAHIKDAIRINRERKQYYATVSKGATRHLSNILIFLEILVLPIAKYYDRKAAKFNRAGIGIIRDDFVAMDLRPVELEPAFKNRLPPTTYETVHSEIKMYLTLLRGMESLQTIRKASLEFLQAIKTHEQKNEIHLAMLAHLVESVIVVSRNGIKYSQMSKGETEKLTLSLIRLHLRGIKYALQIDRRANKFHQKGIGIMVNDLPEIL